MKFCDIYKDSSIDTEVTGISYNSKLTKPGDVFVAVTGFKTDGHKYINNAVSNGAVLVVCEKRPDNISVPCEVVENSRIALSEITKNFYGDPTSKLKLIGVTGTNGKTTVTYLVKHVLECAGEKVGLIGTNKNMIGQKDYHTERTTPECLEMMELFSEMVKEGCTYAVMEVSSHSLDLHRVSGCHFLVGAFTNLTQDHLDFHGTMENYFNAKRKLFDMCRLGVVNSDDEYGKRIPKSCKSDVLTYGINDGDIRAEDIVYHSYGIEFSLGGEKYTLKIPGRFSVYNALCAIGILKQCGISDEVIRKGISTAHGVKGRAEVVDCKGDYTLIIDYAHTPDGLLNILNSVREFAKGRVVAVFGCGGDRDKTKRPKMGKIAGRVADFCIITSDNPRSEDPGAIIRDILDGMGDAMADYVVIENRRDAIEYAIKHAKKDDVIVLAGKGHEDYQILKDKTIHFDEREVIADILSQNKTE